MTLDPALAAPRFGRRPAGFDGYVRADAGRLVDGAGTALLLRGIGLGNWLLPEGYMWRFGPGAESPREIEALVERLAGAEYAAEFWPRFREGFITAQDVRLIAESGFDHVRLPINARVIQAEDGTPIEEGYALIDRLIEWCREERLRVLLDLHGAPGGQTGTNIDDSPHGLPELFMDPRYRALTIRLWQDLAARYADETVVLGYDLLNEPLPNEWAGRYRAELGELYRDLTAAVRAVDPHHLLVYEGAHWATDWSVFTEVWDANSCLQFHKYWSSPDRASIAAFVETGARLGLPIYMGEGGENTLEWIYAAFRTYESLGIGWNLWPWKKVDTLTSPLSITPPPGWDRVVASLDGSARLSPEEARSVLDAYLVAMRAGNAVWQPEVVAAATGEAPALIPAWGFAGHATSGAGVDGIRAEDGAALVWAHEGEHPANPFQQSDGRPYRPEEELAVRLRAGEWLDFDVRRTDGAGYRAVAADGSAAPVRIQGAPGGIRVVALAGTVLRRLELAGRDDG